MLITGQSIAAGVDRELSRVTTGPRAMIFLRTSGGRFGIASASVLRDGSIEKIWGVFFLDAHRLGELDHAIVEARSTFEIH
jgi:hypothetical protein